MGRCTSPGVAFGSTGHPVADPPSTSCMACRSCEGRNWVSSRCRGERMEVHGEVSGNSVWDSHKGRLCGWMLGIVRGGKVVEVVMHPWRWLRKLLSPEN